ncbi:hypothetical protein E2C01_013917 [Portunus trituberculatus]|uniref:Uncharacterized protein n=1 Tax=Portunus trituberculatus TaxID=210409 RepID=A0A5B7DHH2_PORTR|nr:hypothetical protein [Portunus trituberculatus]
MLILRTLSDWTNPLLQSPKTIQTQKTEFLAPVHQEGATGGQGSQALQVIGQVETESAKWVRLLLFLEVTRRLRGWLTAREAGTALQARQGQGGCVPGTVGIWDSDISSLQDTRGRFLAICAR